MTATVRPLDPSDATALARIDLLAWTPETSPAPAPDDPGAYEFFDDRTAPADVLRGRGRWQRCRLGTAATDPAASHGHVLEMAGLAVDPAHARTGIAGQPSSCSRASLSTLP